MRTRILLPLIVGALLAIPSVASADFAHVVTPGESLYSIAAADGLSVDQLAADNGLSTDAQLTAGSTLMIPPQDGSSSGGTSGDSGAASGSGSSSDTSTSSSGSGGAGTYVVQPGDTLSAIAANEGTTVSELAAANGLDPQAVLPEGAVLQVSGSGGSSSGSAGSSSSSSSGSGQSGSIQADVPPYPTPEHVTASQVSSIADANGVSPSLAEAIGWQESGFNNDLVSSADARGVMQIIPSTWDYIQNNLTAGNPLAPASASDNVRGGVLLLHALLSATGGDPAMAAAGYYQGLSSVRRNGLYSDTQQYVNSVLALRQRFGGS
jgi:N-acetylmuramoyl-L-alanine amidase